MGHNPLGMLESLCSKSLVTTRYPTGPGLALQPILASGWLQTAVLQTQLRAAAGLHRPPVAAGKPLPIYF